MVGLCFSVEGLRLYVVYFCNCNIKMFIKQKNGFFVYSYDDLAGVVSKNIIPKLDKYSIIALKGPLGVGKTSLVKEVLKQSGIGDIVSSPTFAYVKTYKKNKNFFFDHFDLYRINSLEIFVSLGLSECFYDENRLTIIEWPEVIETILDKKKVLNIILSYHLLNNDCRVMKCVY
jgi:tRNA threonylcarbamoyladenosine biosynthesis protein TsaE